jgi:hypothetical protein
VIQASKVLHEQFTWSYEKKIDSVVQKRIKFVFFGCSTVNGSVQVGGYEYGQSNVQRSVNFFFFCFSNFSTIAKCICRLVLVYKKHPYNCT